MYNFNKLPEQTVGDLRKALEGVPDNTPLLCPGEMPNEDGDYGSLHPVVEIAVHEDDKTPHAFVVIAWREAWEE